MKTIIVTGIKTANAEKLLKTHNMVKIKNQM